MGHAGLRDRGAGKLRVPMCPDVPRVEFGFSQHINGTGIQKAIQQLSYKGGNTRTGAGLRYISDNFFGPTQLRPGVPKVSGWGVAFGTSQREVEGPWG